MSERKNISDRLSDIRHMELPDAIRDQDERRLNELLDELRGYLASDMDTDRHWAIEELIDDVMQARDDIVMGKSAARAPGAHMVYR